MATAEKPSSQTLLDKHISLIESTWATVPEFQIDTTKLRHLAVICDGNRRDALARGLQPHEGHRLGVETIKGIMNAGKKWGLSYLTFWAWSTENWNRDPLQVGVVMNLAEKLLTDAGTLQTLVDNQAQFRQIGRSDRLPDAVRQAIIKLQDNTAGFSAYYINLAMDYGGMDELGRAIAQMIEDQIPPEEIAHNPELILAYLDSQGQPLPDLIIRTGVHEGEVPHTSGFMPLAVDAGLAFIPDLFPSLTPFKLLETIKTFQNYEMRRGR